MIDSELWPRIRILLVEDQLIVAEDVRQKLQALSYSVLDIVALGQDAIRRTGELRPDLVLMDIKLQGEIDGIETADQIRVQYDIPVVYLTGHLSDEILRRATGAEPFGFVCKPFEVRTLHSAIQVALARHQISRKLRASEARYRLVSELVSDYAYTFRVELDGSLVGEWVTEAFTRITGFTCDEMDARGGYMSLIHPDDVPIVLQRSQALVSNRPDVSEFRIVTRDGEMRWLRDHARPVWDEQQGRVIRIIGAAQDVTSRKQAEESLRQSESLLRSVLSSVPIFVFALDQQGTVTFAAGKGGPFAGAQPTRGVGQRILDLPHEGVDITEDIHRALAGDEFSSTVHVDGGRTFDARYSSLRDLQGEVFGVTGVVIDITERARVEQMLLESKSQLENQRRFIQRIVESIPSSLVVVDEARRIVSVNRNFLGKMRRDEQATLGCKLTQVFPKVLLDYTQLDQKVEMVFRTGQIFEGGTVAYRAPGLSTRIYYYRVVPLRGEESVENVMLLMDDITEQEQLRAEVRQAERHLASVVECADDMVISMDPQGHILTWNRAAARISGLEVEHVQGKPLPALCADEQRSTMARMLERLARGQGVQTTEVNLLTANQRRVPIAWNCSPMRNDTSEVTGIVVVGRDLTEQRSLEAQLLQSAKMVSLGVMAGGIAHELRNPLGIISAGAQLLLERPDDVPLRGEAAAKIYAAAQRASLIIENLLTFARPQGERMKPIDLHVVLEETHNLLAPQLALQAITLNGAYQPNLPQVYGNPSMLLQVFTNLILNARNAMSDGGVLTVSTHSTQEGMVEVIFSDTGVGIPIENLDQIFDPFYTTMPVGKGIGLGLSISYSIIQQHRGTIQVESQVGQGTTFVVRLPACAGGEAEG